MEDYGIGHPGFVRARTAPGRTVWLKKSGLDKKGLFFYIRTVRTGGITGRERRHGHVYRFLIKDQAEGREVRQRLWNKRKQRWESFVLLSEEQAKKNKALCGTREYRDYGEALSDLRQRTGCQKYKIDFAPTNKESGDEENYDMEITILDL